MGAQTSALLSEEIEEISRQTNLSEVEVKRLYKRFQRLDREQTGKLDPNHLHMVPELAINPLHPRFISIFENVNFQQFVDIISTFSASSPQAKKVDFAFRIYDVDNDGFISPKDLQTVMAMLVGDHMNPETVKTIVNKVIKEADKDEDGRISRQEFTEAVDVGNIVQRLTVQL